MNFADRCLNGFCCLLSRQTESAFCNNKKVKNFSKALDKIGILNIIMITIIIIERETELC